MSDVTTIQVSKDLLEELKSVKEYPRQSYSEIILNLVKMFKKAKRSGAGDYDSFLFKIQQAKMKELWDNRYDEVWNNV